MENKWDKLLGIKTTGRDDSQSDQYRYPYEPTPYPIRPDVLLSVWSMMNASVMEP